MPPLCHPGDADPGCHPVPPSATCHPWITEGVQTPGATPVPSPCCERHVPSPCHQMPRATPVPPRRSFQHPFSHPQPSCASKDMQTLGATPVPCWMSSSTHFPPYNPSMLPSALPSFPPSLCHAVLHITTAQSTHHPLQLRGGKLLLNKTKEQLYFSWTFNNLHQPAARQQFPIRRARRMERSGFVGTEGGICRALHEGKNNIAVRRWCCN